MLISVFLAHEGSETQPAERAIPAEAAHAGAFYIAIIRVTFVELPWFVEYTTTYAQNDSLRTQPFL